MYYHHERSAINTLEDSRSSKATLKKIIKTSTLNEIIEKSNFRNKEIDFVSIDVEGYELNVLKGFDLKKYKPKALSIEFIDNEMKKEEFYHQNIDNIINSKVYKHMSDNGYHLVNLLHSDLIFVSRKIFLDID